MPWFALFVGVSLARVTPGIKSVLLRIAAFLLFVYSTAISLPGALTTNAVPTRSEGILLPAHTYNYFLNFDFFRDEKSGSFVYNTYLSHHLSLHGLFFLIYGLLLFLAIFSLCVKNRTP
jgi:hypothetical protein